MSKKKLLAVTGLAAALSIFSPGCTRQTEGGEPHAARQTQQVNNRRQGNREDASVSYVKPGNDFIKSVNLLLSLHETVISDVEKNYPTMGIEGAMADSFAKCRMKGLLDENSRAYTFTDIVLENYGTRGLNNGNFETWSAKFREAGKEAERLLAEPDEVHRKFVPISFNSAFLRRPIEGGSILDWETCDQLNWDYKCREMAKKMEHGQ